MPLHLLANNIATLFSYLSLQKLISQKTEENTNREILNDGGVYSENRDEIYYFGIIDILTNYNFAKKMEYCFKTIRYCSHQMSCIPPDEYQQRFINYMRRKICSREEHNFEISNKNI